MNPRFLKACISIDLLAGGGKHLEIASSDILHLTMSSEVSSNSVPRNLLKVTTSGCANKYSKQNLKPNNSI